MTDTAFTGLTSSSRRVTITKTLARRRRECASDLASCRLPYGGGLTPEREAFRERLRLEAAGRFAVGDGNVLIAKGLRVHLRSVRRRRKAWSEGGEVGLLSKGPVSRPILSDELFVVLGQELDKGPVAHGWLDQTWIPAGITTLIEGQTTAMRVPHSNGVPRS